MSPSIACELFLERTLSNDDNGEDDDKITIIIFQFLLAMFIM